MEPLRHVLVHIVIEGKFGGLIGVAVGAAVGYWLIVPQTTPAACRVTGFGPGLDRFSYVCPAAPSVTVGALNLLHVPPLPISGSAFPIYLAAIVGGFIGAWLNFKLTGEA